MIKHVYVDAFSGFSGRWSDEMFVALDAHPSVATIERDWIVSAPGWLVNCLHLKILGFPHTPTATLAGTDQLFSEIGVTHMQVRTMLSRLFLSEKRARAP